MHLKEALLARGLEPMDKPVPGWTCPSRDSGLWRTLHQGRAITASKCLGKTWPGSVGGVSLKSQV